MARSQARCGSWLLLQAVMLSRAAAWSPKPPIYQIDLGDGEKHLSLYPSNGLVEVLHGMESWNLIHKDPNVVWIVEFYDTGCPHCWYFSGLYPSVAVAVKSATVRVGAFNCVDPVNQEACKSVMMFPTLRAFNLQAAGARAVDINVHKGEDIDQNLTPEDLAAQLVAQSRGRLKILHPGVFPATATGASQYVVDPRGRPGKDGWENEAYGTVTTRFHDAHVGMGRLLMDGYSSSDKYQAALDVVQFVGRAYGHDEQKIFADLLGKLQARPGLQPSEFKAIVGDWIKQFNPKWTFCTTKPCAVWQLFHSISSLISIHYAPIKVSEALPKYRFMVDNFLDCEVCRAHFLTSYDSCLFGRCDVLTQASEDAQAKALVMWLWRTHNAVSQRVITENPPKQGPAIDRRWPAYHECPGCWDTAVVNGKPADLLTYKLQANNDQPVYGVYIEEKVFSYILQSYLGQDPSQSRLFGVIPALAHQRGSPSAVNAQLMLTSCAVAGVAALFAIWRFGHKLRERSATSADEQELLEAAESVE